RLDTRRLHLRPVERADLAELLALVRDSREHLRPWVAMPDEEAELLVWIDGMCADQRCGHRVCFAVRLRCGTLIGCVQVDARGEIGYWLGQAFTSRGLAREAVAAVCRAAVEVAGLDALYARASVGNERSARLAEALGFERYTDGADETWWRLDGRRC